MVRRGEGRWFLGVFFGAGVLCLAAIILAAVSRGEPRSAWLLAGSVPRLGMLAVLGTEAGSQRNHEHRAQSEDCKRLLPPVLGQQRLELLDRDCSDGSAVAGCVGRLQH